MSPRTLHRCPKRGSQSTDRPRSSSRAGCRHDTADRPRRLQAVQHDAEGLTCTYSRSCCSATSQSDRTRTTSCIVRRGRLLCAVRRCLGRARANGWLRAAPGLGGRRVCSRELSEREHQRSAPYGRLEPGGGGLPRVQRPVLASLSKAPTRGGVLPSAGRDDRQRPRGRWSHGRDGSRRRHHRPPCGRGATPPKSSARSPSATTGVIF